MTSQNSNNHHSHIRSYVIRSPRTKKDPRIFQNASEQGRYFPVQPRALQELIELLKKRIFQQEAPYLYSYEKPMFHQSQNTLHDTRALLWIDIGFGNGDALANLAQSFPQVLFLGIEVHPLGIYQLLTRLHKQAIENVLILHGDALLALAALAPSLQAHAISGYFLDPWPKKRHHKRRFFNQKNLALLGSAMHRSALLGIATDWQEYADTIRDLITSSEHFSSVFHPYAPRPFWRQATKYEEKAQQAKRIVRDFIAIRNK